MNSVVLVGNLATEVELKEVGEGRKVASFLLAVDRPGKDDQADFIRISAWERQAELCMQHLAKGRQVGIEGRLRSRSWTDGDGKRRSALDVTAGRVAFLGGAGPRSGQETPFEAAAA